MARGVQQVVLPPPSGLPLLNLEAACRGSSDNHRLMTPRRAAWAMRRCAQPHRACPEVTRRGIGCVDGDAEPTRDHLTGKVYRIGFLDLTASPHFARGSPRAQRGDAEMDEIP